MSVAHLSVGSNGTSLNAVNTAVAGSSFFVSKTREAGKIAWTYDPGTNKPTAVSIAFQISPNNVDWKTVDCLSDPSTPAIRQVELGRPWYVRLNVLSLTIGGGDAFSGRILV